MVQLSVNINKVALLRNQRDIGIPSVIGAAKTVIEAGAYGVTVHPRPDERHIRYSDVYELSEMLGEHPDIEFNIEGNPFEGKYMEIAEAVRPDQATLVPDSPGANTSDHGWQLEGEKKRLVPVIEKLQSFGARVSLFMDPVVEQIKLAKEYGTDRIELYTEPYATAFRNEKRAEEVLKGYADSADFAERIGLGINAGHDLNLKNLPEFCNSVSGLLEVSIGHALIADALRMGLCDAVKAYLKVISGNQQ